MALKVNKLRTYYFTFRGVVKAVDGISFELQEGSILGLAGESACGKSTTAFSLMKLVTPPGRVVSGEALFEGDNIIGMKESEIRKIRWKKISMVFQSSMNALDPVFRIKDQISEAILTHEGIDKLEAEERAKEFLERVGIEQSRANDYPHEFSGGMKQRVMIAMALATYPRIVILDEPTSALDVIVQAQILKLIKNLQEEKRLSIILITHDLSVISAVCDRVAIMYAGKIVENSSARTLFKNPQHPYSEGLIGSFPRLSQPRHSRLISISGAPPDLIDPPKGCRFHPRCPRAMEICKREEPVFTETEENHMVACHLYT